MKTNVAIVIAVCLASSMPGFAQTPNEPGPDRSRPPRPEQEQQGAEALTDPQKKQVKAVLSKFDPNALTAETATAIHEAFREAGLRGGPAMADTIKAAGFDPEKLRDLAPPPDASQAAGSGPQGQHRGDPGRRYSVEQAISDRAQLHTIAFDGLAFLTGDMASNTFLPPGKVADYCGFQYMRDVDVNELGHNTSFVPLAANNMLHVLTDEQTARLKALALEQEKLLAEFAHKRFPLIEAFDRQRTGDIPAGSEGLNREAVMKYTAHFYEVDGLLSYQRAEVLGGIVRELTDAQKAYLAKMDFNDSSTWPALEDQVDKRSMSHAAHVAVMTYASEMFSWYAGNVEADVYFCPERHGTYFGAFFMKDIPAMGNPDFTISTSLTGDSGEGFLATLTGAQRKLVTGLVDQQRRDLEEIVQVRRQIATLLRSFMQQEKVDKDRVMALSRRYGELDGEISYFYAMAFAEVARTLTADQKEGLMKLRNLDPKYAPKGAYLYSEPIDMPVIPDSDFLFAKPADSQTKAAPAKAPAAVSGNGSFALTSSEVTNGGRLPVEFTGDGSSATLPLQWTGAPEGTESLALIMHHVAPDQTKWYWILYDIPATTTALPKNVNGVGTLGSNSVNSRCEYAPPHSKGPGDKTYVYTLFALSSPLKLDMKPAAVSRDVLLAAMKNKVLASTQLSVAYARHTSTQASKSE